MNISSRDLMSLVPIFRHAATIAGKKFKSIPRHKVLLSMYDDNKMYIAVSEAFDEDGNIKGSSPHRNGLELRDQTDVKWLKPVGTYENSIKYVFTSTFDTMMTEYVYVISKAFITPDHEFVYLPDTMPVIIKQLLSGKRLNVSNMYLAEKKMYDERKVQLNIYLATCAEQNRSLSFEISKQPTHALYLDAETGFTTSTLLSNTHYITSQLHAPNDDINACMKLQAKYPGINAPFMSIAEYEKQYVSSKSSFGLLSFVWIDGMGTWVGNKTTLRSTKTAVENLFKYSMLAPYALVAYSVCTRGIKATVHHKDCLNEVRRWMRRYKHKYICLSAEMKITGGVFTSILHIKRFRVIKKNI